VRVADVVDLNSDLGESFGSWRLGDDIGLLDLVSSANVACGFHAGDPATIDRTVAAAAERGVTVGAQVSYPDLVGFGRRRMDVAPADLTADVLYQMGAVAAFCVRHGTTLGYVKPHGALYNRIVTDTEQAAAVVAAVAAWSEPIPVLTLPGSAVAQQASAAGVTVVAEGFADRAYDAAGHLVSRQQPGAVLDDASQVASRAVRMVADERVTAITGEEVGVAIRSLCVHGDTPGAVTMARETRQALTDAGVRIAAFV
jgi:UPF0271 protein